MSTIEWLFESTLRAFALIAGSVLLGLTGYTIFDVIMRYVFNAPLSGSVELTQFAMAVVVFLGLAHCGWTGGHVAVDILERPLAHRSLRYLPAIVSGVGALLFAVIAWQTFLEAIGSPHRVSNMIHAPYLPFLLIAALGCAMYALVLAVQTWRSLRSTR